MGKKIAVVAFLIFCCVAAFVIINRFYYNKKAIYAVSKQIRYSFTLQNKTNKLKKNVKFWAYAPVKLTSTQVCQHIESSESFHMLSDQFGNQILQFSFEKFPPFATRVITIKADLLMSDTANKIPVRNISIFLQPEKLIEVNHPDIVHLANLLERKNFTETVESVFDWVSTHLTYTGYDRIDRGALYALTEKKGDCTEYALLFTALCRANGIPARSVLGYISNDNNMLRPSAFHNWAEFLSGKVWQIADPQNKILKKNNSSYVAMKIVHRGNGILFNKFDRFYIEGDGVSAIMN